MGYLNNPPVNGCASVIIGTGTIYWMAGQVNSCSTCGFFGFLKYN